MDNDTATDNGFLAHLAHDVSVEGCDRCDAASLLPDIHRVYFDGTPADFALIWSMQDGYGTPGYLPPQGYDWSGVRDSEPDTIRRIHAALVQTGALS